MNVFTTQLTTLTCFLECICSESQYVIKENLTILLCLSPTATAPTSFEGSYGKIIYRVRAFIETPKFSKDYSEEKPFYLLSILNLNELPDIWVSHSGCFHILVLVHHFSGRCGGTEKHPSIFKMFEEKPDFYRAASGKKEEVQIFTGQKCIGKIAPVERSRSGSVDNGW